MPPLRFIKSTTVFLIAIASLTSAAFAGDQRLTAREVITRIQTLWIPSKPGIPTLQ